MGEAPYYVGEKVIYNLTFGAKKSLDIPCCFKSETHNSIQSLRSQTEAEGLAQIYASCENYQKEVSKICKSQKKTISKLFHEELQGSVFTQECWKYVDPDAD